MKRLIFASIAILLSVGLAQAFGPFGHNGCNGCGPRVRTSSCAPRCEEPVAPKCYKEIKVPKTVMETKLVEVPARKIVIPQADEIRYIAQPCLTIRRPCPPIPQPDIIEYVAQPDKCVHVPRPALIRYECPVECEPCNGNR